MSAQEKKAYLTYPFHSAAPSYFCTRDQRKRYFVYENHVEIFKTYKMTQRTMDAFTDSGFNVVVKEKPKFIGKKEFSWVGDPIPITVNVINDDTGTKMIRVRLTANTHEELMDRKNRIVDFVSVHGLDHKTCIWDRTGEM